MIGSHLKLVPGSRVQEKRKAPYIRRSHRQKHEPTKNTANSPSLKVLEMEKLSYAWYNYQKLKIFVVRVG